MEEERKEIGLTKEDASNGVRWRKGLHITMGIYEANPDSSVDRDYTGFKKSD